MVQRAMRPAVSLLLLFVLLAFGLAQGSTTTKLKPGDTIQVTTFGQPLYSDDYTVLDDGSVTGKGFGRIVMEGKTIAEARKEITRALARVLRDPSVTVTLKKQEQFLVYVVGSDKTPGPVPLVPGSDVRQLLSGVPLGQEPGQLDVTLNRKNGISQKIDLEKLLNGVPGVSNPKLEPGDVLVVVPKRIIRVWVLGFVAKPGEQHVSDGADVYEAVGNAGGVQLGAMSTLNPPTLISEVRISLRRGTELRYFPALRSADQLRVPVEPGDVIQIEQPMFVRVIVAGEVNAPGELFVHEGSTLQQVINLAKGPTVNGTLVNVGVTRGFDVFAVDVAAQVKGLPVPPFEVKAGDQIYVRINERAIYVLGEVTAPGKYLIPDRQHFDAVDALALAKGLNPKGTLRRMTVVRPDANGRYTAKMYNLDQFVRSGHKGADPDLLPGDIVYFGQPKGFSFEALASVVNSAFVIDTLLKRK